MRPRNNASDSLPRRPTVTYDSTRGAAGRKITVGPASARTRCAAIGSSSTMKARAIYNHPKPLMPTNGSQARETSPSHRPRSPFLTGQKEPEMTRAPPVEKAVDESERNPRIPPGRSLRSADMPQSGTLSIPHFGLRFSRNHGHSRGRGNLLGEEAHGTGVPPLER
jgi:hypothetical protein